LGFFLQSSFGFSFQLAYQANWLSQALQLMQETEKYAGVPPTKHTCADVLEFLLGFVLGSLHLSFGVSFQLDRSKRTRRFLLTPPLPLSSFPPCRYAALIRPFLFDTPAPPTVPF
jgi:hypothetical protein